ncbi:hypothetical protein, partial [Catenulispora rubra]|uniref:hypothetical protein n=1 Tax=Catenulispora rubra TaxID=280293 RepID=UPI001E4BAA22
MRITELPRITSVLRYAQHHALGFATRPIPRSVLHLRLRTEPRAAPNLLHHEEGNRPQPIHPQQLDKGPANLLRQLRRNPPQHHNH